MICLPPHATHILQPLDRTVFKPLKSFYHKEATNFMHNHPSSSITKLHFGKIFSSAWSKAATVGVASKGFQCTGIYPFDPSAIPEHKFLPSLHYFNKSLEQPESPLPNSSSSSSDHQEIPNSTIQTSPFSNALPSPQKIKLSNKPNRPQKRTSKHLTSDINVEEVTAKRSLKLEKITKKNLKFIRKRREENVDSSSDEDDPTPLPEDNESEKDLPCSFCGVRYFSEKSIRMGEWIRCQKCFNWYHKVCGSSWKETIYMWEVFITVINVHRIALISVQNSPADSNNRSVNCDFLFLNITIFNLNYCCVAQ